MCGTMEEYETIHPQARHLKSGSAFSYCRSYASVESELQERACTAASAAARTSHGIERTGAIPSLVTTNTVSTVLRCCRYGTGDGTMDAKP